MRLGDAIREGCKIYPNQAFRQYYNDEDVAACAMGAAQAGAKAGGYTIDGLADPTVCPECSRLASLDGIVVHINDIHLWTRERIADWADTL